MWAHAWVRMQPNAHCRHTVWGKAPCVALHNVGIFALCFAYSGVMHQRAKPRLCPTARRVRCARWVRRHVSANSCNCTGARCSVIEKYWWSYQVVGMARLLGQDFVALRLPAKPLRGQFGVYRYNCEPHPPVANFPGRQVARESPPRRPPADTSGEIRPRNYGHKCATKKEGWLTNSGLDI